LASAAITGSLRCPQRRGERRVQGDQPVVEQDGGGLRRVALRRGGLGAAASPQQTRKPPAPTAQRRGARKLDDLAANQHPIGARRQARHVGIGDGEILGHEVDHQACLRFEQQRG
jgi:hypothetical protein